MFTTGLFQTNQIDADVTREIIFAGGDEAPFIAFAMAQGVQRATSTEIEWADQAPAAYRIQINNAPDDYDAATTTIVVDSTSNFRANDLAIAEATGEVIRVVSITNSTTMVIERGVGATTAAVGSVADDAYLRQIGSAHGEGSDRAAPTHQTSTRRTNYCQIFKEGIELTGTALAVQTKTEDERPRQRMLAMRRFMEKLSRTAYFGVKSNNMTDANGRVIRTMDGVYQAIQSNVYDPSGVLTEAKLWEAVEPVFASGSPLKMMLAGSIVVKQVNTIFGDRIRNVSGDTAFGINARRIITPFGELDMVFDRALNGPYSGDAIIADPEDIRVKELRPIEVKPDVQSNGADTEAEEIIGELSLAYGAESHHGRIENTAAA